MKVSVVIPAHNEEKYIGQCLSSLKQQIELPDEIIVVNNNSNDKTVQISKQHQVKIITEKKQGLIQSRNRGFDTSQYEIIARCDADSVLPPDWIKKIKKSFRHKKIDALTGPVWFYESFLNPILKNLHYLLFRFLKKVYGHDILFGPNMALTKKMWKKVKNEVCLDDKKVHEDIDLSLHIAKHGVIEYNPELTVLVSARTFKRPKSIIEYPYRWIKSILNHPKNF